MSFAIFAWGKANKGNGLDETASQLPNWTTPDFHVCDLGTTEYDVREAKKT